jgi:hypothetical protein
MKEIEAVVLEMWHEPFYKIAEELVKQFGLSHEHAMELTALIIEKEYK